MSVVICTKGRPCAITLQLQRLHHLKLFKDVIVVDSNHIQGTYLVISRTSLNITFIHTPDATMGRARQAGLSAARGPITFMVDDDITFWRESFLTLWHRFLESDPSIAAMSGVIVFGYPWDPVLMKLFKAGRSIESHSNGYVLFRNELVNKVGGFDPAVHIGEDLDLATRLLEQGYHWIRCKEAFSYHAGNLRYMIKNAFRSGKFFHLSRRSPLYCFGRLLGKLIFMPLYYAVAAKEPRILIYYALMNWARLRGYAWRVHHATA